MTIITTDIELLEVFYAHTITPFMIYIVQSLAVTIFLMFFSFKLAFIALAVYIIIGLVYPLSFKNRGQLVGEKYRRKLTKVNNNSSEQAYGIFETLQYNKVREAKQAIIDETEELTRSSYVKNKFLIDLNALNVVTYNFGVLAFIYFATTSLDRPNMILASGYVYRVIYPYFIYG